MNLTANMSGGTWHFAVVNYHHEKGRVWADSPQMPGWTAAADTQEELSRLVGEATDLWLEGFWGKRKE